ncbi:hypothetical protein NKG05_04740 [Oerskovia sp. M15]
MCMFVYRSPLAANRSITGVSTRPRSSTGARTRHHPGRRSRRSAHLAALVEESATPDSTHYSSAR